MDDVFKILVWIIIIISFVSSILKKKKTQPPAPTKKPDNNSNRNYEENIPQTEQREERSDVLKEIERLFKGEPPQEVIRRDKEEEKAESSWNTETASEHTMQTNWEKEKQKLAEERKKVDSKVEEEAKRFEKFLNQEEKYDKAALRTIKQRLNHPESLKEFIVISEIIGKPKALRR